MVTNVVAYFVVAYFIVAYLAGHVTTQHCIPVRYFTLKYTGVCP